jgi:ketosteroid isomerase-like protein
MSSDTLTQILTLESKWTAAEQHADTAALDQIAAADFRLVGPFGFVLDKSQWLDRYVTGGLVTSSLDWSDVEVRDLGDAAISIGKHTQTATYQGHPADGQFRATHVFVRKDGRWQLASMHLSQAAPPPPPAERPSA